MSSKPRSIEAQRLESNYLSRLQEALGYLPKSEAVEIEENVTEHIRAAIEELDTDEVGLSQMAVILEELGSPESLIVEPEVIEQPLPDWLDSSDAEEAGPEEFREAEPEEGPEAEPEESPTLQAAEQEKDRGFLELLDRIFAGYVIYTIGLYIPVIDFFLCSIIAYSVILWNIRRSRFPGFAKGTSWAIIALIAAITICPAKILGLVVPPLMLLTGLIAITLWVAEIALFWNLFSAMADGIEERGLPRLAGKARACRIYYIIANFLLLVAAIPVAMVVAEEKNPADQALLGLMILPLGWIFGWFVILRPLRAIRRGLRESI